MFAISARRSADIILIDERLSVRNEQFADSAKKRLVAMINNTTLLVIASHDKELIRDMCARVVQLDHGRIAWSPG